MTFRKKTNWNNFVTSTPITQPTTKEVTQKNRVYYVSGSTDNSPEYKSSKNIIVPTGPVVVKYSYNYNILYLHSVITKKLSEESKTISSMNREIKRIEKQIEDSMSVPEISNLCIRKELIQKRVNDLTRNSLLSQYQRDVRQYIKAYKTIPKEIVVIDIMNQDQDKLTYHEIQTERIVDEYLSKAAKYIQLEIHKEITERTIEICISCRSDISDVKPTRTGVRICHMCGSDNKIAKALASAPKEYNIFGNFLKAHKRNVGMTELKFDVDKLIEDLDEYFINNGMETGEYYKSMPCKENGRKQDTSVNKLCAALKAINQKSYYKHYALIGSIYWGWQLPSLDHLLPIIEKNFRAKQEEFDKMEPQERGSLSALPTEFRLWAEYNHAGYKCSINMFKISRKPSTLDKYIKIYTLICEMAGFKFPHE